ncbi:MAG TPA: phosphate acetyltransferase, partial [Polyangiales bacterium]
MPHTFYLAPSGHAVGLTSVALGLVHALDKRGIKVAFYKPIGQSRRDSGPERSTHFVANTTALRPTTPIALEEAERLISSQRSDDLLERVIGDFDRSRADADVVIVEGLIHIPDSSDDDELNLQLIKALSAEVIVVAALRDGRIDELAARLNQTVERYGGMERGRVIGCIINRIDPSVLGDDPVAFRNKLTRSIDLIGKGGLRAIGLIPENGELGAVRTVDIATQLGAKVLHEGELRTRRVRRFSLLARTVPNVIDSLTPGSLLVTPSDRSDVVLAVAMAALKNVAIAGLIITADGELPPAVLDLCGPALATGLPLLGVKRSSWDTACALANLSSEVPADDLERARMSMSYVATQLDTEWLLAHSAAPIEARMSPAAFCYRLVERAARRNARIVLPEGTEPRTIKAAIECSERGIARCVLLADPAEVQKVALGLELTLPERLEIVDPVKVRAKYVAPLVEMRKQKGVSEREAAELLEDNVWLGTMMLALGEVDGLVSGA